MPNFSSSSSNTNKTSFKYLEFKTTLASFEISASISDLFSPNSFKTEETTKICSSFFDSQTIDPLVARENNAASFTPRNNSALFSKIYTWDFSGISLR